MTSNQTSPNHTDCDVIKEHYVAPVLSLLMFPAALLLNGVAAWVALHLRSTTSFVVYLKNLVAADLLMTLIIPFKATSDLLLGSHLLFQRLSCGFFSIIFYSVLYTCIGLLGLISLDRFFKIMTPSSKMLTQSLTFSRLASAAVWMMFFVATALPNMILSNRSSANMTRVVSCMKLKGPEGIKLHEMIVIYMNVFFWCVSVVVVVCYICIANKVAQSFRKSGSSNNQGKQKVKLRVFLVVIVFFVAFGPYHVIRIPYTFLQVRPSSWSHCSYEAMKIFKELSLWMATTNICMDPLLYVFLCREFKERLLSLINISSITSRLSGE